MKATPTRQCDKAFANARYDKAVSFAFQATLDPYS